MKKRKNPLVMFLAGLGLAALGLVTLSCLAALFFGRSNSEPAVSRLPTLTPTGAPAQVRRSGEASKDLGFRNDNLGGSSGQAAELLKLIEEQPGKVNYVITYSTDIDTVLFACNFEQNVIVRIHQQPDDHGSQESWRGYVMERLQAAAFGSGSLNDTPEGKIPVVREDF